VGGEAVVQAIFDWVDFSGITLIVALILALALVWFWPHDRD
jgi:hypothetical protein